ncbi:hypothetical protein, partial [Nitrosococcus oceani]|uniref:hypothetical protein n=1 Tax=Nitrosococcus oceani TaxID=1229 RepID=UPI001E504B34
GSLPIGPHGIEERHEASNGVDSYSANSDFIRNKYSDKYSRGICCLVSKALNFFSQRLMYSYA